MRCEASHLYLSSLAGRYLAAPGGQRLGRLSDVIVRLGRAQYPPVTGLVARVGGRNVFVPAGQIAAFASDPVQLTSAAFDLRRFERRDGEVLLRGDVLGHRLIEAGRARPVRAADLRLSLADAGWVLDAVDTHHRPLRPPLLAGHRERVRTVRDWREFEPPARHTGSRAGRGPFAGISKPNPTQTADLLEDGAKAGGLMGLEFLALPGTATVGDALAAVARSGSLQPEALASVHAVDADGHLIGVARLATLLQADLAEKLARVCDTDPVRIGPDTSITDAAVLMADRNLTTIPVTGDDRRLLGLITVDDVLEATLPAGWRRRPAAGPPDACHPRPASGRS